jgi:hypothetical protein
MSQQFKNQPLATEITNDVDQSGRLRNPEVAWLSRGLAEACLDYINSTKAGDGLRLCAYEFTWLQSRISHTTRCIGAPNQ